MAFGCLPTGSDENTPINSPVLGMKQGPPFAKVSSKENTPVNSPVLSMKLTPPFSLCSPALSMKQTPPFSFIPRPFSSPRPLSLKRPLETELQNFDNFDLCEELPSECPPVKRQSLEIPCDVKVFEEVVCSETPERRTCKSIDLELTPEEFRPVTPSLLPVPPPQVSEQLVSLQLKPKPSLDAAVKVSMHLFKEALTAYALELDRTGYDDTEKADKFCEQWAADHYEELRDAMLSLLPWTGEIKSAPSGAYDVMEFQGRQTPQKKISAKQLEHFRSHGGSQARAWEALCAVLAVVSSREQLVWLDYNIDLEIDVPKTLSSLGLGKARRGSAKRMAAIRDMIPKLMEDGAGGFAKSLIDPRGLHSITFTRGPSGPVPATSTTVRRMPLWDALKCMDDEGPLRGVAADKEWCWGAGRQFALQDLKFGYTTDELEDEPRKGRIAVDAMEPDTKLRDLLRSKRPVRLLDTLAALAPREVCKEKGLSKIVTTELQRLLVEAKAAGEAVVFHLGSDTPHKLAEKVYLRPPLADNGMRCGCLRWREGADMPWARERELDERIILCIQMP